jgi:tripartite-type tricarboxylate transporter receptor subunit TctC
MAAFTHAVSVFLYRSIGYDPVADFQPVTLLSWQPCVMIVPTSSPVQSVADFISYVKANHGKMSYASAGHGTSPHLCGELFKNDACAVSHRCPARSCCRPHRRYVCRSPVRPAASRPRRGLAVTTAKRVPAAPELPTMAESGLAGFDLAPWWGLFLPAKTAPEVVARLHSDTIAVLAEPEIQKRMQALGSIPVDSTPEEFARYIQAEIAKWGPTIRDANIRLGVRDAFDMFER